MMDDKELKDLLESVKLQDGKINYLMMMFEAKQQAQSELLVEILDIIGTKKPGTYQELYDARIAELFREKVKNFNNLPVKK